MASGFQESKKLSKTVECVSDENSVRKEVRTTSISVSREELRMSAPMNSRQTNRIQQQQSTSTASRMVQTNITGDDALAQIADEKDKNTNQSNTSEISKMSAIQEPKKKYSESMSKALTEIGQLIAQESDYQGSDDLFSTSRSSGLSKFKDSAFIKNVEKSGELSSDIFEEMVIAMRSLLARRRFEIEHLKSKVSSNDHNTSQKNDKQLEKYKKEIESLKEEIDSLRIDNDSAEKTKISMSEKVSHLESIRDDLENELWLLRRRCDTNNTAKQENMQLTYTLMDPNQSSTQIPYQDSRSTFLDQVESALKEQVSALNDENEKLHQMANDFRRSRELLEDELEDMKTKERNYKWEVEQKGRDVSRLESQLEYSRKEIISLKEQMASLKIDKEFAEKSRDEVKSKIMQIENNRNDLEYELSVLKSSQMSLKSYLSSEQQQNEELIAEKDQLKQDSTFLREKNMQLMSEKMGVESQLEQTQNEMLSLRNEIDELMKIKNELETSLRHSSEKETKLIQDYEESRQEMERQLFKLNNEFSELNRRLNEVGKESEKLNKEKNEYKTLCAEIRREKNNCDNEIRELKRSMNIDEEEKRHLEEQLTNIRSKKTELEKQKDMIERYNNELQVELENCHKDIAKYKSENDELLKVRINLANKVNAVQHEFEAKLQQERSLREKESESLKHDFEMEKVAADARNEEIVNQMKIEKERQIGEYQEELSKLRLEFKLSEQEYSEKVTQLEREKLNFEIQSQREKNALISSLNEKEAALNYKLSEIEEISQKLGETEELKNNLDAKITEIETTRRKDAKKHQDRVEALNTQVLDLTNEKLCLEEEKKSLLLHLQREKEDRLSSEQSLKQASDQMCELTSNYDKLVKSNVELKAHQDLFEKEIRIKDEKLNSLTSLLSAKEDENLNLLQSIENYEKKLADEENLKEDLIKDMNELRSSLMEIEKSRLDLKKQINNNNVFQKSLENELKAKIAIIEELNVMIERKAEKDLQREEELKKLKNLVVDLDSEKQNLKAEIVNCRHKLVDCEHVLNLEKTTTRKQADELRRLSTENNTLEMNLSKIEEDSITVKNCAKNYEQKISALESKIANLLKDKRDYDEMLLNLNSIIRNGLKLKTSPSSFNTPVSADSVRNHLLDLISKLNAVTEDRDDLQMQRESFEHFSRNIQETNASLKIKHDTLEEELRCKRKDVSILTKEIEEVKSKYMNQEEALDKCKMEKKYLCGRLAQLCSQTEKLEKEKRNLMKEIENIQNTKSYNESEIIQSRDVAESKIKKLEATRKSLESRVADLLKRSSDANIDNESFKEEIRLLKRTIKELQESNLKLHSALNDSNIALKRRSEEEHELKKKVTTMSESIGDHDRVSKDVVHQLKTLKSKIDELTNERTFLQQSLDANRDSLTSLKETNRQLNQRIKQLDAELHLTVTKMKNNEELLDVKSNVLVEKEAKIKQLQDDLGRLEERNKHLENERRTLMFNSAPQTKRRGNSFQDESLIISQGLAALEEQNIKLQRKVKSLQSLMNDSETPNNETSRLKQAQKQAESLLEVREKSHKKHIDSLQEEISSLKDQLESFQVTSTPSRFLSSPVKHSTGTSTPKRRLNL
ncbi:rootletin-like protein [Leptotrombidium deliense]|uniref:Rootletin-like protein n=1 Tax=Leptotrombidium deliense TaxID=299467 RepID=A0A443SL05_9ACAR|nr:rootletin-like protein [Leptotrombidium deliense]